MQPPLPSATPTWHNDTYPAISPSRPELSAKGKTVIITGAGSGIGRATAKAFATAGASKLVFLGRNREALEESRSSLPPGLELECITVSVDITDEQAVKTLAQALGQWDVLVMNAGYVSSPASIQDAVVSEWWSNYEVKYREMQVEGYLANSYPQTNVKGTMLLAHYLLPSANPDHAAIIGVTSGMSGLPPTMLPGLSGYISSKLAAVKLLEFLAAEKPNVFVASLHPGMVETDIFTKSGAQKGMLPMDTVQLPAHFAVWLTSPEATFLKGRSVFANWDVEELKAQASNIGGGSTMTTGVVGWPYPYVG